MKPDLGHLDIILSIIVGLFPQLTTLHFCPT